METVSSSLQGTRFELHLGERGYPNVLAAIPDPPACLYGIGNPAALVAGVAIIGARKATPYGLACTERFAAHVARRGLPIIAGGAIGCDLAAHRTAVDLEARTIVVFGSSPDILYPKRGRDVFQRAIDQGGAVVSESPWGTPPLPGLFVQRNRIIAGLSRLIVIAEAGLPSGTFSTADAALAQGKEVAVVPGAITSPTSAGANRLLAQGALPLIDEDALDDALAMAFSDVPVTFACDGTGQLGLDFSGVESDELLRVLAAQPAYLDELASSMHMQPSKAAARLSRLELAGSVERGRDGRYHVLVPVRE